jgi:hypothetical protein
MEEIKMQRGDGIFLSFSFFSGAKIPIKDVIITQYFPPTHGEAFSFVSLRASPLLTPLEEEKAFQFHYPRIENENALDGGKKAKRKNKGYGEGSPTLTHTHTHGLPPSHS